MHNFTIEFHRGEKVDSCEYHYDGYRVLHYESGKKGVRYLFRRTTQQSHNQNTRNNWFLHNFTPERL